MSRVPSSTHVDQAWLVLSELCLKLTGKVSVVSPVLNVAMCPSEKSDRWIHNWSTDGVCEEISIDFATINTRVSIAAELSNRRNT